MLGMPYLLKYTLIARNNIYVSMVTNKQVKPSEQVLRVLSHMRFQLGGFKLAYSNPRTRSYKRNSGVNYAEFCYAKNFNMDFLVKNFGIAKSSVIYAGFSFIGLGPG